MKGKKIDPTEFWKWFAANEAVIRAVLDDEFHTERTDIVESLNNFILDFGMFSWEIGEGRSDSSYLVISPNGNPELLSVSRKIVSAAPELPGWEFHYAKQPKSWDMAFTVYDELMELREIDASDWKFRIERGSKGKLILVLIADSIAPLDEDTRHRAADILITGELGEENRIRLVEKLVFADASDDQSFYGIEVLQKEIAAYF